MQIKCTLPHSLFDHVDMHASIGEMFKYTVIILSIHIKYDTALVM